MMSARLEAGAQRTLEAVACSVLIRMEAPASAYRRGTAGVGLKLAQEEEPAGDSTPRRTRSMVASTGTPAPCPSVS
jgi:hypothetical protein